MTVIEEFIATQDSAQQARLTELYQLLKKLLPEATEKIAYGIPTFFWHENVIHFGPGKKHVGLYPGADGVAHFLDRLGDYKTSKGTIQLPNDRPLPIDLITEIVDYKKQVVTEKWANK